MFLILVLIAATTSAAGQRSKSAEINSIDAYCKGIEHYANARKVPDLIFADVSGDEGKAAEWREFASTEALEKYREDSETYVMANNWLKHGRIVMSVFTFFSNSGDWAKYVYSCFRADGSLAKVTSDYRTFYGDFIVEEDRYFSPAGRLLKKRTKTSDLVTGKPKVPDDSYIEANSHLVNKADYFMNTGKLPFAGLLKSKSKK